MSSIPRQPYLYESGLTGPMPSIFSEFADPDATQLMFLRPPVGTIYIQQATDFGDAKAWIKVENEALANDWIPVGGFHVIQETVTYDQFTDGGGAAGTYTLTKGSIPIGAVVYRTTVQVHTAFTGTTTCVLTVGDGSDVDRYNTGTPSIFTAGLVDMGAVGGTAFHAAAKNVVLTATEDTDWGDVTQGKLTVRLFYLL